MMSFTLEILVLLKLISYCRKVFSTIRVYPLKQKMARFSVVSLMNAIRTKRNLEASRKIAVECLIVILSFLIVLGIVNKLQEIDSDSFC